MGTEPWPRYISQSIAYRGEAEAALDFQSKRSVTNTNGNRDLEEQVVADILSVLLPSYAEKCARDREQRQREQIVKPDANFRPDAHLLGQWHGHVHTYEGDIQLMLWFKETGDVYAQIGTQLKTLVNKAQFKEQFFEGVKHPTP